MDDIENLHYAVQKACQEGLVYKVRAVELERFLVELSKNPDTSEQIVDLITAEIKRIHSNG